MAIPRNIQDRELQKFFESGDGNTTVRVGTVEGLLSGISYDYLSASYPDQTTEIFTYKLGGSGGTTVATVTIVYTDSTKENISTVTKV